MFGNLQKYDLAWVWSFFFYYTIITRFSQSTSLDLS